MDEPRRPRRYDREERERRDRYLDDMLERRERRRQMWRTVVGSAVTGVALGTVSALAGAVAWLTNLIRNGWHS